MSKAKPIRKRSSDVKQESWDKVRELALSFPGVVESTTYATHAFKVNGKLIARYHQDGDSLAIKVQYAAREVLMGANPKTFYVTDNYRCWPWMFVRIANIDPQELRGLLEDAWRSLASKRNIAAWEASK